MSAKIYCACQEADKMKCDRCPKNKRIKPDYLLMAAAWPRIVRDSPTVKIPVSVLHPEDE